MNANPYPPPVTSDNGRGSPGCASELAWLILPPILGLIVGFLWYAVSATIVESIVMPKVEPCKFPYGGAAMFMSWPLSTFYGLLTGFAVSVLGTGKPKSCAIALIIVAVVSAVWTTRIWLQFENAAECSSKYVVFYPLFAFSFVVLIAGLAKILKTPKR